MFDAIMLIIAVVPKMLGAKLAERYAPMMASFDHSDFCLNEQVDFIRNNNCPIPAANGLPVGG